MMAGGREIYKEYYKFNLIPLGKDAGHLFLWVAVINLLWISRIGCFFGINSCIK
jgi:hypothetical protein